MFYICFTLCLLQQNCNLNVKRETIELCYKLLDAFKQPAELSSFYTAAPLWCIQIWWTGWTNGLRRLISNSNSVSDPFTVNDQNSNSFLNINNTKIAFLNSTRKKIYRVWKCLKFLNSASARISWYFPLVMVLDSQWLLKYVLDSCNFVYNGLKYDKREPNPNFPHHIYVQVPSLSTIFIVLPLHRHSHPRLSPK